MTVACDAQRAQFDQLLAGFLSDQQAQTLRAHLAECSVCRTLLDRRTDQPQLQQWLDDLRPDQYAPSTDCDPQALLNHLISIGETYVSRHDHSTSRPSMTAETSGQSPAEPCEVGPFRVLAVLGRGGMGVVYKAHDPELDRMVAVKVVLPHRLDEEAASRFLREARAAGSIQHPHVVPVYSAACSAVGAYLVMQYVEGQTLRERIQTESELSPREAARLVQESAEGLSAAHRLGLIHRDVKPGNILIDAASNQAKVFDFGLARFQGVDGLTQTATLAGTPEYMSPEQLRDPANIDARADVYGLGATLYQALTGIAPFRGAPHMVLQQVLHDEPTPPRLLNDRIPRDLETICLKALAKEPGQRYQTASALSEDLGRFLQGEPIRARPEGHVERLARWCKRNPAVAGLSAVVLFLLIGGVTTSSALTVWAVRGWNQANQNAQSEAEQRQRAEDGEMAAKENEKIATEREAETTAVLDFIENKIFAAAQPEGWEGGLGREVTLRDSIEAALPFVEGSFDDQPLIEARLRSTLGISFARLGDNKIALEQHAAARALYTHHRGPHHPDTLMSMHNLAGSYYSLGRHAEALQLREETLALRKAILGPDHLDTLRTMLGVAGSYFALGRTAESLQLREELLPILKAKFGPDHPDTLSNMGQLANLYLVLGRYAPALQLHEETLPLIKAKLGPEHPETLLAMRGLANTYTGLRRHAEALKLREESLALQKAKLGLDHPATLRSMTGLANTYEDLGRHAEALTLREETLALQKAKLGHDHLNTLRSMMRLASSYHEVGRYTEAQQLYEETLALRKANLGPEHPDTLWGMLGLADSYAALGKHADALQLREEALALLKAKLGPNHPITLESMSGLAWLLATMPEVEHREPGRAVELAFQAVEMSPPTPSYAGALGAARYRAGDWKGAAAELEEAISLRQPDDTSNASYGFFLAMAYWQLSEQDKAREWFARSLAWMEKARKDDAELKRFHAEAAELIGSAHRD